MVRIGVYGASGYAGQDVVEILSQHPHAEIIWVTSTTYAGDCVPFTGLTYIPHDEAQLETVEAVFLALPHTASAPIAAAARARGVRVVDLSADFRLDDVSVYEDWYAVTHPQPDMLPVPYGLVEANRAALTGQDLVAVPGCYPTATLLGLLPLLQANALLPGAPIIVDAKSGVTGAGRTPKPHLHFPEVYGNLTPYKTGRGHRHVPEIEQFITAQQPDAGMVIFSPHLIPVERGLMASIYVQLKPGFSAADAHALYTTTYTDEPLIRVLPPGSYAELKPIAKTNRCDISITPINDSYLHITSVIDNLRKGAAGQAIQCFNVMMGYEETTAL